MANYQELNEKYSKLVAKIQEESDSKFDAQVKQREEIIKSQAEQIHKILWESHKLREFIRQELNLAVHPIDFNIFRISDLDDPRETESYNLIQDQSDQILNLRKKVYLLTNELKDAKGGV